VVEGLELLGRREGRVLHEADPAQRPDAVGFLERLLHLGPQRVGPGADLVAGGGPILGGEVGGVAAEAVAGAEQVEHHEPAELVAGGGVEMRREPADGGGVVVGGAELVDRVASAAVKRDRQVNP
jgi:hypothetical protein